MPKSAQLATCRYREPIRKMTRRVCFFMFIIASLLLAGCSGRSAQSAAKTTDAIPVIVATAVRKSMPVEVRVIGNVEAYATITVKAQIGGELQKVYFREGDAVRKGDLLFMIDPRPYQGQVNRVEANLAKDSADLQQAQANLARDKAQEEYPRLQANRYSKLFEEGLLSREQFDQARTQADAYAEMVRADEAAIESSRAAIEADRAALTQAKVQLSYCSIRSPIDGRTGNLMLKQGNVIKANDAELVTINQIEPIYVTFSVPESRLPVIRERMRKEKLAVLAQPQGPNTPVETGVLAFLDNAVDVTTGTIKLKGTFENRLQRLWPGQFVQVSLHLSTQTDAVAVPAQAVQTGQEGQFVFVVKPDMTIDYRPVIVGMAVNQELVIEKGLQAGERVVTEGQLRIAPGNRVQIKEAGVNTGSPPSAGAGS
jgi:membrane fusion protein, multidrug efflux system